MANQMVTSAEELAETSNKCSYEHLLRELATSLNDLICHVHYNRKYLQEKIEYIVHEVLPTANVSKIYWKVAEDADFYNCIDFNAVTSITMNDDGEEKVLATIDLYYLKLPKRSSMPNSVYVTEIAVQPELI